MPRAARRDSGHRMNDRVQVATPIAHITCEMSAGEAPSRRRGEVAAYAPLTASSSSGLRRFVAPYMKPPISDPPSDSARNAPAVLSWSPQ